MPRITLGRIVLATLLAGATASCAHVYGPWPQSSQRPRALLDHAPLSQRAQGLEPAHGFKFVVFGDQRALADGETQEMMERIGSLAEADPELLFMIDTGDNVQNGAYADQFATLLEILSPAKKLPYFLTVGNHEVHNNRGRLGREQTAAFLSSRNNAVDPDRFHYRLDAGGVCFLFLNTNDLVYGEDGSGVSESGEPAPGSSAEEQMIWLEQELSEDTRDIKRTVVCMHHPLLQSSAKHQHQARDLWSYRFRGRRLPDILLDGGVDLIFTGHTHTYERFRIKRDDGREMTLVNVSGRPRDSFLWIGAGRRRAVDIQGEEAEWLARHGWANLDGYTLSQEDAMTRDEANQFALVEVESDGGLFLQVVYLDSTRPSGLRPAPRVELP